MRVVLTDGTEFACKNFKALDSGVLLTKDKKRKKVIGFVPLHQLRYVVPDDLEPVETPATAEDEAETGPTEEAGATSDALGGGAVPTAPGDDLTIRPPAAPSEPVEGVETAVESGTDEDDSELRRLGGLGSTYAERLQSAGYRTLADLAAADPVAVAEAASVAPGRGRRWVDAARRAVTADDGEGDAVDDGEGDAEQKDGDDAVDAEDSEGEMDAESDAEEDAESDAEEDDEDAPDSS